MAEEYKQQGWIVKCNRNGEPIEEWTYIPRLTNWHEDENIRKHKIPSDVNYNILCDCVLQDTDVTLEAIIIDKNLLVFDKSISNQNYFRLIYRFILHDETNYFIYAPGRFLQIEGKDDSDFNKIKFTLKIEGRKDEFVLSLPKEISEEPVIIPPRTTRITYKKFAPIVFKQNNKHTTHLK
jgi:hypothetical protein